MVPLVCIGVLLPIRKTLRENYLERLAACLCCGVNCGLCANRIRKYELSKKSFIGIKCSVQIFFFLIKSISWLLSLEMFEPLPFS